MGDLGVSGSLSALGASAAPPRRLGSLALLTATGAALFLGALLFVWWLGPALLTRHPAAGLSPAERLKATNDVRTTLVGTLVGLAAIGTVAFAAVNARINQRALQETLAANRAAQEAQRVSHDLERESQITDLYVKAVDQLGSQASLDVRLGAIYALGRIAEDSARDRETVIDILTSFIRVNADKRKGPPLDFSRADDFVRESAPDVVAAVQLVGRLPRVPVPGREVRRLDLRRIRVQGADLQEANLRGARLNGAELVQCNLSHADLGDARLSDADIRYSDLRHAKLTGAYLDDANLLDAQFNGACLRDAKLHGARYGREQFTAEQLAEAVEGD
jgi:hypothetical protein